MKYKDVELKEMETKNINWTFYETPSKNGSKTRRFQPQ